MPPGQPSIAIIGAGMSGMAMAVKLVRAGYSDVTVLEKAKDVGGTWRENTYPGLTCDVPAHYYVYSFAKNPDWTHAFAPGAEIQRYFKGVAEQFGLRDRIRFDSEVAEARWDGERWQITTTNGDELSANVLVSAAGVLHHPRTPDIPGLESFKGAAFHSARFDHDVPLEGRRVGVIGNGSTGVQLVCGLAGVASETTLFQRTPQWVVRMPNPRMPQSVRNAMHRIPALTELTYRINRRATDVFLRAVIKPGWQRKLLIALCHRNLATVNDPDLRRRLTPDYTPMCKRLVAHPYFYETMERDDVALVDADIDRVEPEGIRTADGVLHELDVLVLATGFDALAFVRPAKIIGEGAVTIDEAWSEGPRAYRTVALPAFPNFFMIMGPNSPVGNISLVPVAEEQADFILRWVDRIRSGSATSVMPKQVAMDAYYDDVREAMKDTVWVTGCTSWYLGPDGMPTLWPWDHHRFREYMGEPVDGDWVVRTGVPEPVAA